MNLRSGADAPPPAAPPTSTGPYAGDVTPQVPCFPATVNFPLKYDAYFTLRVVQEAFAMISAGKALLCDIRTSAEVHWCGYVPGSQVTCSGVFIPRCVRRLCSLFRAAVCAVEALRRHCVSQGKRVLQAAACQRLSRQNCAAADDVQVCKGTLSHLTPVTCNRIPPPPSPPSLPPSLAIRSAKRSVPAARAATAEGYIACVSRPPHPTLRCACVISGSGTTFPLAFWAFSIKLPVRGRGGTHALGSSLYCMMR